MLIQVIVSAVGGNAGFRLNTTAERSERAELIVDCAGLRAGSVNRLTVKRRCVLPEAAMTAARVVGGVTVDVTVEMAGSSIVAAGELHGVWAAECRRCLGEVRGSLATPLREIYEEHPSDSETWPVRDARIDLAPAARQAAILALPLAPLCSPDCAGPVPDRFPTGPAPSSSEAVVSDSDDRPIDPRWSALSELRFDD